jgi:hypothetical protein
MPQNYYLSPQQYERIYPQIQPYLPKPTGDAAYAGGNPYFDESAGTIRLPESVYRALPTQYQSAFSPTPPGATPSPVAQPAPATPPRRETPPYYEIPPVMPSFPPVLHPQPTPPGMAWGWSPWTPPPFQAPVTPWGAPPAARMPRPPAYGLQWLLQLLQPRSWRAPVSQPRPYRPSPDERGVPQGGT